MPRSNCKYITKRYVCQVESEDVIDAINELGGYHYEDHSSLIQIVDVNPEIGVSWTSDTRPISIAEMRRLIDEVEKSGATHMQIQYHPDHYVYNVDGILFRASTEAEIAAVDTANEEYNKATDRIKKLQVLIDEIKEEYNDKFVKGVTIYEA